MDLPVFGYTAWEFANALAVGAIFTWVGPLFGLSLAMEVVNVGVNWIRKGSEQ